MSGPAEPGDARWEETRRLFEAALELPRVERTHFVAGATEDAAVRAELDRLLRTHERLDTAGAWGFDTIDPERAADLLRDDTSASVEDLRTVGPYDLLRALGRGGMGVVYLARDRRLDRLVALKLLPPRLAADEAARERLFAEARAASALDHEAIATVYDVGRTAHGTPYIAMAYCEGETLEERLERERVPVAEAGRIALVIADALRAAHRAGIVHSDLKPSNVIMCASGGVRLIDFGIARLVAPEGDTTLLDGPLGPAGTLAYMSPEQTRGDGIDPRTDVWALGVMLYEMLAGRRPFEASDPTSLVGEIRDAAPRPLKEVDDEIPAALAHVIETCMSRDPEQRYSSGESVLDALADAVGRGTGTAPHAAAIPAPRHFGRGAVAALVVGLCVIVALATAAIMRYGNEPDPVTLAILPFEIRDEDPGAAYLAHGIRLDIYGVLTGVPGLRLLGRSSMSGAGAARHSSDAAGALAGAGNLLSGSVERSADRVRIVVRLVNASRNAELVSDTFAGGMGDLLAIEARIAGRVAEALGLEPASELSSSGRGRPEDPRAHELYLRGRYVAERRTGPALRQAIVYYTRALAFDSTYVSALAGMAEAYSKLDVYGFPSPTDAGRLSLDLANRAVALDSSSADAWAALGSALLAHGDYEPAAHAFRAAIEMDPDAAQTHHIYGFLLATRGELPEAIRALETARTLDPLALPLLTTRARVLLLAGRERAAHAAIREAIELDPEYPWSHQIQAAMLLQRGQLEEADNAIRHALRIQPEDQRSRALLVALHAARGDSARARQVRSVIAQGTGIDREYALATSAVVLGDVDVAFEWLERIDWNSEHVFSLIADPVLDPIRSDPRYARLAERVGARTTH